MLYAKRNTPHPMTLPFTSHKRTVRGPWRWWLLAACLALILAPGGAGAADLTNTGTISGDWTGASDPDTMTNESTGSVSGNIIANDNSADNSSGGSNIIINYGSVDRNIRGSYNAGDNSSGGGNEISNSGAVDLRIFGSHNSGDGSSGGSNTINNSGTVGGSIYGSRNYDTDSSGGDDSITNSGTVGGGIYGSDGNDTVILETSSSSVGGVVDGGTGTDTLGFSRMCAIYAVDYINSADCVNFEHVGIYSGPTTLAGAWDLGALTFSVESGGVCIIAGGATLTSPVVTVKSGGVMGGNGVIVGDVINYGTISPGNSIGALTVNGNFINEGGWLVMELGPNGSDLLRVNGTATLNGGYLRTSLPPDLYVGNESWTVLTADSIIGSFDGVISPLNSATLSLHLSYSGNSVGVSISRKPYADFATSAFERVVGAALDDIIPLAQSRGGYMADLIIAMDFGYSADQITNVLRSVEPDMYPAYAFAQLESAGLAAEAVDAHLDQARDRDSVSTDTSTTGTGISVWARAVGAQTSLDASRGWPGCDQTWGGIISGADYALTSHSRLGLALGYTVSDMSWDDSSYSGDVKTLHLLAYGGGRWNDFYAQASAGVAWHQANAQRTIDFAGSDGKVHTEPDAFSYLAGLKGGYDFHLSGWRLGPLAGFRYIHLEQDGFSEPGDGYHGLNIASSDTDSLISTLGFSASTRFDVNQTLVLPRLGLAWQHEFEGDPIGVTAWFTDYADVPMVFSGRERPTDRMVLDLGLSARLAQSLDGSVELSQTWGQGYLASALSFSLQYNF